MRRIRIAIWSFCGILLLFVSVPFGARYWRHTRIESIGGKPTYEKFSFDLFEDTLTAREARGNSIYRFNAIHRLRLGGLDSERCREALSLVDSPDSLTLLMIVGNKFSDADFDGVVRFRNLTHLYLWHTKISTTTLRRLSAFPNLRDLRLMGSQIDDAALSEIAAIPSLRDLDLGSTRISDRGLAHLSDTMLTSLILDDTTVTDNGLAAISNLPLTYVSLNSTRVTERGVKRLQERHPGIEIQWSGEKQ